MTNKHTAQKYCSRHTIDKIIAIQSNIITRIIIIIIFFYK